MKRIIRFFMLIIIVCIVCANTNVTAATVQDTSGYLDGDADGETFSTDAYYSCTFNGDPDPGNTTTISNWTSGDDLQIKVYCSGTIDTSSYGDTIIDLELKVYDGTNLIGSDHEVVIDDDTTYIRNLIVTVPNITEHMDLDCHIFVTVNGEWEEPPAESRDDAYYNYIINMD